MRDLAACSLILLSAGWVLTGVAFSQRVAVLAPSDSEASRAFVEKLEGSLEKQVSVQDNSLAEAAFKSFAFENAFNLTKEQSRAAGAAMGCEYFVLVRATAQRRSSSARPEYYEAVSAVFVVSSRSGRLVDWKLLRFEASKPERAGKMLSASIAPFARRLASDLKEVTRAELTEPKPPQMEEPPDDSPAAERGFRAPIPYRRIKPEYTDEASLYDVAATVDIVIDLDAAGSIQRTEVVRWAGYGLDGSVEKTVRSMNWRPAERNGMPLPMRFLVRYNFKKIEKQEDN